MTVKSPDPGLQAFLDKCCARLDESLARLLPPATTHPANLHKAMRYAALGSGKRIRPALVFASGQAVGSPDARLDGPACAVECIHAYSLIHDDLPSMDDDDLRRGKPSCHKAFDEATAILAGDALQALGFHILAHNCNGIPEQSRLRMIELLAQTAGSRGMVGGQAVDLESSGKQLDIAELEYMHIHKTGALIRASVVLGALTKPGIEQSQLDKLDHYAKCVGLAFQIRDDILDVEGETETLGKQTGADRSLEKPTYPALIGLQAARKRTHELHENAMESLANLGPTADPLRWISLYTIERNR